MRGHVAKKGNRYYAVIYQGTHPGTGKPIYKWVAAGRSKRDADKVLNDLVRKQNQGEEVIAGNETIGRYLTERWLPLQRSRLRRSTYSSYKSNVELHVVPHIGRIRLDRLRPQDLERLYVELLANGLRRGKSSGGLSPTSVRYIHRIISKALADAHRHVDAGHERGNVVVPMTDHPPASDRHDASRSKVIRWLSHRGSRPAEASASAA